MIHDVIVVGEGIAGLTCASECARLGLRVATYEAEFFGGLVVNVNELDRFDEAGGLSGMDHAATLAMANRRAGVASTSAAVTAVRRTDGGFEVETASGSHAARFVVIATGARPRRLDVPGEAEFEGRGVSHCADCDAPLFTGMDVAVAGSGDWALRDALLLARECATVHVVHAEHQAVATGEYLERANAEPRIRFHPGMTVCEVHGGAAGMTGLRARDADGAVTEIPAAGLFVAAGLVPNGEVAPDGVQRDPSGALVVDESLETGIPGLWAIGLARAGFGGWLADAAEDARRVAASIGARSA